MDENEIKAVSEAMEQLRQGGQISAETLQKLGGTTQSANKALAGYTQKLLGVSGAMGGMAKAVADGEGSFKSLGSSITGLTGLIGNLASAIPLVGGAAKALAEGVGQAAKFVLDQLDTMAKNYQTLGDASAGAADGVDGLLRQFNQLGNYSLPAFSRAVKNNTLGLAAFQGTAAAGAEELSKVAGALTTGQTAQRFLKLGMSLDAVGDATATYLADSARYGITQSQTTEELTKKTQNYIVEVDKIARLTGQTREAQAKEAQKSLADARFRAKLAEMTANGQEDQAEELRKYVEGLGGAAGDAARALVTGIPLTKEAASANLFASDAIRQNTLAIQEGKKATEAISDTQQALADGTVKFSKQVQYGGDIFGGVYVQAADTAAILKEQNKLMSEGMTREEAIARIQEKQAKASGKNTDQFTKAQLATADASKNIQSLGFSLAEAAIPAVNKFAEVLDKTTEFIAKKFGVGGTSMKRTGVDHGTPGGAQAIASGKARGTNKQAEEALKFFQSAGWTKEQAAGIVGNLQVESDNFAGDVVSGKRKGDGGKAVGVAQWHPERQADFKRIMGKDVGQSTLQEQLKFVDWELKNTERTAGEKLKQAKTAAEAARIVDMQYERSSGAALGDRMASAEFLAGPKGGYQTTVNPASPGATPATPAQNTTNTTKTATEEANETKTTAQEYSEALIKKMTELVQTSKNLLEVNKKILARQS